MPHDYLYHRVQRRTSTAQWRFFYNPPGYDDIATSGRGRISDFARSSERTANSAYWIPRQYDAATEEAPANPIPEELLRSHIPDRAPGPQYVAPWRFFAIKSGGLDVPASWGHQTDFARGYARTSEDSYFINAKSHPTDEIVGMAIWNIPEFARGPERGANPVYFITGPTEEIIAEVPAVLAPEEVQRSITDIARGPNRTANLAYLINLTFPPGIADVATSGRGFATLFAKGPARAGNSVYWVSLLPPVSPPEFEELRTREITDFARGFQRAPNTEYSILESPPLDDEVAGMPVWILPDRAPGPQRAAAEVYWRDNANLPPISGEVPGMRVWEITDLARGYLRTANEAYWRPSPIEIVDLPTVPGGTLLPLLAPGKIPTANDAYFILTKAPVLDVVPSLVVGRGFRTDFAPRSQPKARAANSAYWRDNPRQLDDGCIFVCLDGFQLDTRAVNTAYQFPYGPILEEVEPVEVRRALLPNRVQSADLGASSTWQIVLQINDEVPTNDRINEYFRFYARADAETYWQRNYPRPADEPPPNDRIFQPTLGALRAPNGEYWIGLLPAIAGEVQQNTRIFVPLLIAPRAPESVYWNDNRITVETVQFPVELMWKQIPVRADGPIRAPNSSYDLRFPPFEVPPDLIRVARKYFVHTVHRKRGHNA